MGIRISLPLWRLDEDYLLALSLQEEYDRQVPEYVEESDFDPSGLNCLTDITISGDWWRLCTCDGASDAGRAGISSNASTKAAKHQMLFLYDNRPVNSVVIIDQPALTHLGFPQTSVPEVEVEDDMPERYLGMNSPYMGGRCSLSFNMEYEFVVDCEENHDILIRPRSVRTVHILCWEKSWSRSWTSMKRSILEE